MIAKTIICAAAVFGLSHAQAQNPAMKLSPLQQEEGRIEAQRKAIFDAENPATRNNKAEMPGEKAIAKEMLKIDKERKAIFSSDNPATSNTTNSFPNIATPDRANVDIQALAKRYEAKGAQRKTDGLIVFVSFSMPGEALKKAVIDARKAGGVVVLRGFKDNSIKATSAAMSALGQGGLQINPGAFTKYRIKSVPAVVLIKPEAGEAVDEEGCAFPDKYAMVSGDVGLSYSLEAIAKQSKEFAEMAERYRRPLMGGTR